MSKELIVSVTSQETKAAILENDQVIEIHIERDKEHGVVGAICKGRVMKVLPGMQSAFVDIGLERDAFLYVSDFFEDADEYDKLVMKNPIFRARTIGIGAYSTDEAMAWGVTGPGLRATGYQWDLRKQRPYSGYDRFEFDIPVAHRGDSYDRAIVRVEEMRQSCRIIRQCVDAMPTGPYKSSHPLTTNEPA